MGTQVYSLQNTDQALDRNLNKSGNLRGLPYKTRTLAKQMIMVQEDERLRVARELHDQIGEPISALKSTLEKLRQSLALDPAIEQEINSMRIAIDQVDREVDHLALELRPPGMYGGLHAAFSEYVLSWLERADCEIQFMSTGLKMQSLAPDLEIIIFRFFQEAMCNIFKHARAKNVFVSIEFADNTITLSIEDDGVGFEVDQPVTSLTGESKFGLKGMKDRIELVGGRISLDSARGKGTSIKVQIPVDHHVV